MRSDFANRAGSTDFHGCCTSHFATQSSTVVVFNVFGFVCLCSGLTGLHGIALVILLAAAVAQPTVLGVAASSNNSTIALLH